MTKKKILDSWKRRTEIEVFEDKYGQQLEFNLQKPREATPEEVDKWQKEHLQPLGDAQLKLVAFMSVVQFMALATMMMSFYLIGLWANG